MKVKLYPSKLWLILLLLFGIVNGLHAQTLDLNKTVNNITTGGDGTTASQNDVLEYTIVARNLSGTSITNAKLRDYIPAGTAYVAGSTTLNGAPVADASGTMPYDGAGSFIQSPSYPQGVLAYNAAATVKFRVRVTANGGNVTNYATVEGSYNGSTVAQNTNTVFTNLSPDASCSAIYQSTASSTNGNVFQYIRTVNTTNGTGGPVIYDGSTGPCYNAITGAALAAGSVMSGTAAIAYDKNSNRIYFVNNDAANPQDLCYVDLNTSPVSAKRFVGYPLETTTGTNWNVNRMAFASDGYGYAITSNARDIIRFYIDAGTGLPVITRLGALINDGTNGANDILAESGGDIFGDGSGNLYLIANSSKLYKINPNTRVATFLGSVNPFPGTSNAMAIDATGKVYIGGSYQNVYTVNLSTMAATSIRTTSTNVWTTGDYTSCALPVLAPALNVSKTYRNTNGSSFVVGGDTVEYVIEVTNTGNINAAGVKLYDSIPGSSAYIPGSTTLNGTTVADVSGTMPFSVPGGRFIYSPGEQNGIVKPGAVNKAIVTFRVKTDPLQNVCNQSRVTLMDVDGNNIFVNSDDPSQSGSQNSTCFYSDGLLPMHALQFTGSVHDSRTALQWFVREERNVAYYDVEYSDDGNYFVPIGRLSAVSSNEGLARYRFTDEVHSWQLTRYYRLKVISEAGRHSYSNIVRINSGSREIQIGPNPFTTEINLQLHLRAAEIVQVRLMDLYGTEVITVTKRLTAGAHSVRLHTPAGLKAGVYMLEVTAGDKRVQKKMIKL